MPDSDKISDEEWVGNVEAELAKSAAAKVEAAAQSIARLGRLSPNTTLDPVSIIYGMTRARDIFVSAVSETFCDSCKSPWRWDDDAQRFLDPVRMLDALIALTGKEGQ